MSTVNPAWPVLWTICGAVAVVAAVQVSRQRAFRRAKAWLYVGRAGVGVLFVVGGALMHVINLIQGFSYAGFADPAHVRWIADTWRSVVPPNQDLLMGVLAAFEAGVGVLILSGGRRTQLGLIWAVAFHACLWIFGWIETAYCIVMIPTLVTLLVAEHRAAARSRRMQEEAASLPLAA